MQKSGRIPWVRIVVSGIVAEFAGLSFVFLFLRLFGQRAFLGSILVFSAALPFLLALWVCRHTDSLFVLNGTLIGVVMVLVYVALTRGRPEPFLYIVAHALKLLGGAAGGLVASRHKRTKSAVLQPT